MQPMNLADMSPDSPVTLYVTVSDREQGIEIGKALVDAKLAACANVSDGLTSIFSWDGHVQTETEAFLFAKTRACLIEDATKLVTELHSYDCPCVVALPIVGGNTEFIDWIRAETAQRADC